MGKRPRVCLLLFNMEPHVHKRAISFREVYLLSLLVASGGWVTNASAQQAGVWDVITPRAGSQVRTGEFFFAANLADSLTLDPNTVRLYVGGEDLSAVVKISGQRVSALYVDPLPFGPLQIRLLAADANGTALPPASWGITVVGGRPVAVPTAATPVPSSAGDRPSITGSLIADSRNASFSGLGSSLRQEPGQTNVMQFSARVRYRGIRIPIRIYTTSDEDRLFQPRNRFQVGVQSRYLNVYLGDNNPRYESLLINGTRVRGLEVALRLGPLQIVGIHGELQRGIEGSLQQYTPDMGIPPPNLRVDSTFVVTSVFQRKVTAARLAVGSRRSVQWGVHAMKAVDDTGSIQFGEDPKENVVGGTDLRIRIKRMLQVEAGAAMSITTDDVSRGVATKAEIDSTFNINLPIDPKDYEDIIVLNGSTFPLDLRGFASLAWYSRAQVRLPSHIIRAEYRSVGDAYVSFANPFIRSDRRGLYLRDRFQLFDRRMTGSVRFEQYEDNLSSTQVATRQTRLWGFNISGLPLVAGPRLLVGFQRKDRESQDVVLSPTSDALVTFSLGANYAIRRKGHTHGFNVVYTRTDRTDDINPQRGSEARTVQLGFTERFPFPLSFGVRFMQLNITSNAIGTLQDQQTYAGNVRYAFHSNQIVVGLTTSFTSAKATDLFPSSTRLDLGVQGAYTVLDDLTLRLRAGLANFDEAEGETRDYTENYIFLGLTYGFQY